MVYRECVLCDQPGVLFNDCRYLPQESGAAASPPEPTPGPSGLQPQPGPSGLQRPNPTPAARAAVRTGAVVQFNLTLICCCEALYLVQVVLLVWTHVLYSTAQGIRACATMFMALEQQNTKYVLVLG